MPRKECSAVNCHQLSHAFGYCKRHYYYFKRYGDATATGKYTISKSIPKGRTYVSYINMLQRCNNPKNSHYAYYGARNIKVCDRWLGPHGYEHFFKDMGERPDTKLPSGKLEYSLDRINPDDGYHPGNCRWADKHTQVKNRRQTPFSDYKSKGYCYCPKGGFWMAYLYYRGKRYQIRCRTQKEAIRAREALIARYVK